jgi:CO dehydrogenase/acetyl-CoA synthase gamma subunit (corrinoid Fe-S protein)
MFGLEDKEVVVTSGESFLSSFRHKLNNFNYTGKLNDILEGVQKGEIKSWL